MIVRMIRFYCFQNNDGPSENTQFWGNFFKVSSILILHEKFSSELTCENFCCPLPSTPFESRNHPSQCVSEWVSQWVTVWNPLSIFIISLPLSDWPTAVPRPEEQFLYLYVYMFEYDVHIYIHVYMYMSFSIYIYIHIYIYRSYIYV